MQIKTRALMASLAILWGAAVLAAGIANMLWPPYAEVFMRCLASIYPGYHYGGGLGSVIYATVLAFFDGGIAGLLVGWLYNLFA
jgi:hypothetical protein